MDKGSILRILDSKDLMDQKILQNAPLITDFLAPECKDRLDQVMDLLQNNWGISCTLNPRMVRGLDYYCETIFEFIATDEKILGPQQGTVLAGGTKFLTSGENPFKLVDFLSFQTA